MSAKTMSLRSIGLSFLYLLLLGFSITFLSGCGNSLSTVGTVFSSPDPPEAKGSQEQATVNRNAPQSSQTVGAEKISATTNLSNGDLDAAIKANKGWQLIDIREPREYYGGHILTAVNIPLGDLENNFTKISKDKDIVIIDLNGTRSEVARQAFIQKGYDQNKLKVLTMLQWKGIGSAEGSKFSSRGE